MTTDTGSKDVTMTTDTGSKDVTMTTDIGSKDVTMTTDTGSKDVTMTTDTGSKDVTMTTDTGSKDVTMTTDIGSKDVTMTTDTGSKDVTISKDVTMTTDIGSKDVTMTTDIGSKDVTMTTDTGSKDVTSSIFLTSLFPLVLLSMRAALTDAVSAPRTTFTSRDPITGVSVECDSCPPGTYLRARCTSTLKSVCAPCPSGSFTELWNYIGKCLRCGVCGQHQVEKTACTADKDCQCECKQGYYYKEKYDMCLRHSECQYGEGVLTEGTAHQDTVCYSCVDGTFSNTVSAQHNCTEHRNCSASGLQLVLRGSAWHDSVCASCDDVRIKEGADYLREILPSFFVHQKLSIKRLRRVAVRLPYEGHSRPAVTTELNRSALYEQINAWIASATATQIRQLPETLTKVGVTASERLENKLKRIDSHLSELCDLTNEVDTV
ncbi:Tumor necrosis factor receptor superfamily member 6B [Nibea albiflora]|uniref:Tumor necrosis factor receptor superfamily member 6B n=1 Tax=Nibea albiflora TaxID=240163 RepID=A0ACB7ERI8_NIBAL|nr:Tumor necrosis factor receptor superfamily member 6B [Nibea albiflora]